MTISWKRATTQLKQHIPQLEEEDDPNSILFICYCDLGLSIDKIADLTILSPSAVRAKLLKIGIQLKKRGGSRRKKIIFSIEDLREMNIKELCTKYKVCSATVSRYRRKLVIKT